MATVMEQLTSPTEPMAAWLALLLIRLTHWGELQDNGGPTLTQALLPDSPAIDAGSNPEGLKFDQRGPGSNRIVGDQADIGAYEVPEPDSALGLLLGLPLLGIVLFRKHQRRYHA